MKPRVSLVRSLAVSALLLAASAALAQEPCPPCPLAPPPKPDWTGRLGAGLALSGGNSDTKSYNLAFAAAHDPGKRNVFKADGLYIRSDSQGEATINRTAVFVRDEYKLGTSGRAFAFGEVRYQRDVLKGLDYLISPLAGIGYKVVEREKVKLSADAAAGGAFEGLAGLDGTSDGAVQASQSFEAQVSKSSKLTERASGLWKMSDFGDAYYRFEGGLVTSVSSRLELKLAYVLDHKTLPANPTLEKTDNSFLATLVFKIG
jgi:putative salt-induced outer membrane protein